MLTNGKETERALARLLLERLKPLATRLETFDPSHGMRMRGRQLFGYCCVRRERLARISAEKPLIGIVLSGEKEFWLGDTGQSFGAGDVFILPAATELDVVNLPSDANGLYESLLVEIEQVPAALRSVAATSRSARGLDLRVTLTPELVDALSHAAILLSDTENATALSEHRLAEVLLLLARQPAAAGLFSRSLPERISWLVVADPSRRWTATTLGQELGMAGSTLRRKLEDHGTSMRETLSAARMQVAHALLSTGDATITDAVAAAGYASRSHFARRFQAIYGLPPAEVRPAQSTRG
ncbi:helix-turn-helix domain-containing protein [Mesorhizobium sp. NBSH29]|uniref:helix-turn-helix domain-containing protein n=1 Tax=Mesorhizobium sp. NBSH29 TaxID=2654249 RepID=UPI00189674EC|nr:helix-turn-helix domain-containing protein [Mesorhizobium sp. NBSH29]QPC88356.1 helix-turn-helix domain-containing protein [Mesorhizobium sp. NBSH29]